MGTYTQFFNDKTVKGGPGSGNFGHSGRPGKRGGSAPKDEFSFLETFGKDGSDGFRAVLADFDERIRLSQKNGSYEQNRGMFRDLGSREADKILSYENMIVDTVSGERAMVINVEGEVTYEPKNLSKEELNEINRAKDHTYAETVAAVSIPLDKIYLMNQATLTHNHPTGSSFSPADIYTFLLTGLKEIRAVANKFDKETGETTRFTYRLRHGEKSFNIVANWSDHRLNAVNDLHERSINQLRPKLKAAVQAGKMTREEAQRDFVHMAVEHTISVLNERYGTDLIYERFMVPEKELDLSPMLPSAREMEQWGWYD